MNVRWYFVAIVESPKEKTTPNKRILLVIPGGTYSHVEYISEILLDLKNKGNVIGVTCTKSIYSHISDYGFNYYELKAASSNDQLSNIIKRNTNSNEEYQSIIKDRKKFELLSIEEIVVKPYKEVYRNIKSIIDEFKPDLIICDYVGACVDATRSKKISVALITSQLFGLGIYLF